MRPLRVRLSSDAEAQIRLVAAWWRAHRRASPGLFRAELGDALEALARSPELGTVYYDSPLPDVRQLLMLRTRYHLYYTIDLERREVFIRALWHTSRGEGPTLR